jgi:nicotinamidase-related amidase
MAGKESGNRSLHGTAPDRSATALLILDMISDFEFEDGERLHRAALPVGRRIARLRERADRARVPVVYVNDNLGRWRSDFVALFRHCAREGARGAALARLLAPRPRDYCVLKPKHSGFFATPLDTLLEYFGARRLVLTGATVNQCVLFTANDAYVRDFELFIPRDCVAGESKSAFRLAFRYFRTVLGAHVRASPRLRLARKR